MLATSLQKTLKLHLSVRVEILLAGKNQPLFIGRHGKLRTKVLESDSGLVGIRDSAPNRGSLIYTVYVEITRRVTKR